MPASDEEGTRRTKVIALVTSAGGLDALSSVLRALPEDLPAAVVIAQHLGGQGSVLVSILGRRTGLPVRWAEPGAPLTPGCVTVCPPRSRLEVLPDLTCAVAARDPGIDERPLDALLQSLAESVGEAAAGVVLTGMLKDGAHGAKALHEAGGLVIAQSPDTAEHPAMPRAAVDAGGVDLVLPLHEIGATLADAVLGRRLPLPAAELQAIRDVFGTEGVTASMAAEIDWSRTAVGRVAGWSPVLRTAVGIVMACPDVASLWWGDDLLFFTNDAAVTVLGGRERTAFAQPYRETFADVWDQVAPAIERAQRGHSARYTAVPLRYVRDGRLQDMWTDLTDTPIKDQDGRVVGICRVAHERTAEILSARRLTTLNALGRKARASSRREALGAAVQVLSEAADVPFAAAYLLDPPSQRARLVAATGLDEGGVMAPRELHVTPDGAWPVHAAVTTGLPVVADDIAARFRGHLAGADRVMPHCAVVHPLRDDAEDRIAGVLIVGADPYLSFDERYRDFLALTADTVAARMAEAHARHRERERLERLADLDRAKTEFFSNVSHEFRTPLTLMLGPLDAALDRTDSLPAALVAELEVARRNAQRLLRLTGALLDFSQAEAGRLRAHPEATDLAARTREIVAQFDGAAARAGLTLRTAIEPVGQPVWVDPEMWEKILANLLSNALKYTLAGSVEVELHGRPKHAELVVRDTGVGIPEAELPHIFKRFHRVHGVRGRTQEGVGIGLALVDELVRRHHGRVRAVSAVGAGTAITVWIPFGRRPVRAAADETPGAAVASAVAAGLAEEAGRWAGAHEEAHAWAGDARAGGSAGIHVPGASLLVVDDNQDMRDYLYRLLAAHWTVRLAHDGVEALEFARLDPPDLVLSDVMMPGIDGFALLSALRADPALADVPVVLVTARAGEEAGIEGLLAGADDYIVKPFTARELVARIGAQLELTLMRRRQVELDAFRVALTDTLRSIADPVEVQARAAALLGRHLGASRAYYQEFDRSAGTFTVHRNYTDGLPSLAGTYSLADYSDEPVDESHRTGRTLVVPDAAKLDPKAAASWAALSVRAGVAAPNMRSGVCVAALGITSAEPRDWTGEEIALIEETAERTWAYVERVRAEQELRQSEERFRTVADAVPALIWQNDAEGGNVFVNRGFRDYTGLTDAQIGGERWQSLVHPDEAGAYVAAYLRSVRERTDWRRRNRLRRRDGAWRTFDNYATPLFAADGSYLGHVGVSVDVTDRR
ncbi:chemotaxis protein CheB [Dactylosporangium sp. CS-033363]|uniref:chemotaxis protein CheB n=1 Tax=Dactylosporangium sp. CS-033363 TaxID=3239935 RepID=UPI003D8B7B06